MFHTNRFRITTVGSNIQIFWFISLLVLLDPECFSLGPTYYLDIPGMMYGTLVPLNASPKHALFEAQKHEPIHKFQYPCDPSCFFPRTPAVKIFFL
jgi:hypothetical protein